MAKQLDEFDFKRGRNKGEQYPMEWLDGNIWELTQEEDFPNVKMSTFYSALTAQAKRLGGLKVRSRKDGENTIIIQAYSPETKETE
jgi:hypothetical protein